jgi:hypothetical protein
VLRDLQDPETNPERGKHDDGAHLQGDQSCADAPSIFCYGHEETTNSQLPRNH